ncbi:MAG: aspartate aminotransferase family protein [Desulfomonilaceae bacterium]
MIRPGNVFHRKIDGELPTAVKGDGAVILDENGRSFLDASGGAVVVNVGHGRREIADAVFEQLCEGYYFHPTMFTTRAVEALAERLAAHAPHGISRFYFMTTGSEAVETAIKFARQVHVNTGRPGRHKLISRWRSYHGLTLGALAATGRTSFRSPFSPMIEDAIHIPPPYCLRCPFGLTRSTCALQCAVALEEAILNQGPNTVSAFIGEPVSGASLAVYPPPQGYWPLVRKICDRYGVLLILDEVMTGMGRTGKWFASEHYDVIPDIVTLGKGISGGALPLSATGVREDLYAQVIEGGGFAHGGTFSHHPVCAAAGLAVMGIIERDELIEKAASSGQTLGSKLSSLLNDSPFVADVRGIGMMWGIEFVTNKETLEPFPRSRKVTERLWDRLFSDGIVVYKSVALAGADGDGLVIAPPFTINEKEMDTIVSALDRAVTGVLGR